MKRKELPARDGLLEITKYIKSDAIAKEIHRDNAFLSHRMNHSPKSGRSGYYNFSEDSIANLNVALRSISMKLSDITLPEHRGNEEEFFRVLEHVLVYVKASYLWKVLGYDDKRRWHEKCSMKDDRYRFKVDEVLLLNKTISEISHKLALIFLVYQE